MLPAIDIISRANSGQVFVIVFFTFVAVFFLALGYMDAMRRRGDIKRRAILDRNMSSQGNATGTSWFRSKRSLRYQNLSETSSLLGDVERRAKEKETESAKIRKELSRAGFFGENAVIWYQSSRLVLLATFVIVSIALISRYFPLAATGTKILVSAGAGAIGFILPSRYISVRQSQIVEECRKGFPDFVDLMVICADAGLSPRGAIDRLSREVASTYPYLGANLYLANLEVRAGISLHEALFNLGRRTAVEEASTLASLLQQTEELGTSITDALRIYSEEMRERRLNRAEERAHALPVKLVLPLGLFVFPVILIVILLPVVIRVKNAFL